MTITDDQIKHRLARLRQQMATLELELATRAEAELAAARANLREKKAARQARSLAKKHGIDVSIDTDVHTIWIYPPDGMYANEEDDPWYDHHYVDTWEEALERVTDYIQRKD
jgi:multidrug efflux pump subunit AcrA (membrane-fusion protein)